MKRRFLIYVTFLFAIASVAFAQERILSYDSEITVNSDGSMLVKESIKVHAEGRKIVHGIYRDFPTDYRDKLGIRKHVPFDVVSVRRDGHLEPYHTANQSNGVRVYMGPRFSKLPPGDHTYELTYRTDRQLGFFSDRDELYWNVTGLGWDFPIEHASALVKLPANIPRRLIETWAYTGPAGYKARDFSAKKNDDGSLFFESTRPFAAHEGLTIDCWWDKGYMQPPTDAQKREWFFADNQGLVFALIGLLLVLAYQFIAWSAVGKDPAPGTIVPLYMPPEEISAAGMREMVKMRFDNKAFAACIVSMAAKKFLTINKDALDAFTLTKSDDPKALNALSDEEKLVATRLFARGSSVLLTQANHEVVAEAVKALKQSLAQRMEKIYFVRNGGYLLPSVLLTILTLALVAWNADSQMQPVAMFMMVWLSGWSVAVAALSYQAINLWKAVLKGGGHTAAKSGGAIFLTLFALPFLGGWFFGIFTLAHATSAITVVIFGALVASNFVFHELLKAPTHMGRELLDKVQGFKMFLAATEGDQIKRMAPVNWNLDTFNRFLPYAIALDVEAEWAGKFSEAVTAASAAATSGGSMAYSGAMATGILSAGFAAALGDSLTGAIASASTAPGSSSGSGGGGSSGGGGGGGGGGGW